MRYNVYNYKIIVEKDKFIDIPKILRSKDITLPMHAT